MSYPSSSNDSCYACFSLLWVLQRAPDTDYDTCGVIGSMGSFLYVGNMLSGGFPTMK